MIVIDVGEPASVFEAFDKAGVPYIKDEIRFYWCEDCKVIWTNASGLKNCTCGGDIKSERAGDFTNTTRSFLVERKKPEDFIASMLDKSLHSQAARMAKFFKGHKILMLEGYIMEMLTNPYTKKFRGWIKGMRSELTQYNIYMWQCGDMKTMIYELQKLDDKSGKKLMIHEKLDDKYTGWSDAKKLVCKLIDVSHKKADILLEHFGSPWDILNAIVSSRVTLTKTGNPKGVEGPMKGVKGFGPKFILKNQKMLLNVEDSNWK